MASNEPNGIFRIDSIKKSSSKGSSRLTAAVTVIKDAESGHVQDSMELFFEVPKEYGKYLLTERCDAFVVLFLHRAVSKGYDIVSSVPMSSDLYYNITEHLLPVMNKNSEFSASLDVPIADPPKAGFAVGTGLSCGVDSLSTIKMYVDHPDEDLRLTHLCMNNVGAFNVIYSEIGIDKARKAAYARSRQAAEMIGLPFIETNSNVHDLFPQNHFYTHSFSSMFAVFCLSKLWKTYHYSSSGVDHVSSMNMDGWSMNDSATYELLLFRYLSTRRLMINSAGELSTRLDKIRMISDYDVAQKFLYSCTASDSNCGVCDKCMRNLTALDCIGKLDGFSEAYDIQRYRNVRPYFLAYVYSRRTDEMHRPVFDAFVDSSDPDMDKIRAANVAVEIFDRLWSENNEESDVLAFKAIFPYRYTSTKAGLRIAKAYSLGRGVERNPAMSRKCLHVIELRYRKEIKNGIERSRYQLFDFLWGQKRYGDLVPTIEPLKDSDLGKLRYAKMYRYGIGLEKDETKAREIMEGLVRKNPRFQSNYLSMFPESKKD